MKLVITNVGLFVTQAVRPESNGTLFSRASLLSKAFASASVPPSYSTLTTSCSRLSPPSVSSCESRWRLPHSPRSFHQQLVPKQPSWPPLHLLKLKQLQHLKPTIPCNLPIAQLEPPKLLKLSSRWWSHLLPPVSSWSWSCDSEASRNGCNLPRWLQRWVQQWKAITPTRSKSV